MHVERPATGHAVLRPAGHLNAEDARWAYDELRGLLREPELRSVVIDFSRVQDFNSVAAAAVGEAIDQLQRPGKRVEVTGLTDRQRSAFALVSNVPWSVRSS